MFNASTDTPCKDCKNRTLGCHDKCQKYLIWRKHKYELGRQLTRDKKYNYMKFHKS